MTRRLEGFTPLWPAEQRLVDWIRAGNMEPFRVSGSLPPEDAPKEVRLRASFVRYLALGGCDVCRVLEKGLGVWGAYIEGDGPDWAETRGLDLEGCDLSCDLALFRCRFPDLLMLRSASVRSLYLEGSNLHVGLIADGLKANGSVVLNNLQSQGEVRLLSAHLGGYLACEGGSLTASAGSKALSADGLEVNGSVFLRDLKARGAVRLLGARLGGDLSCLDARLTATAGGDALLADRLDVKGIVFLCGLEALGEVRLLGARLGGDLDCNGVRLTARPGGRALNGDGMRVEGTFFLRAGAHMDGVLDLTGAQIGHLNDSPACWPEPGKLALDRCRYGAFTGLSPVNAASRIRWLSLQDESRWGAEFWPQPWEECARVLREMGHGAAAREILIEKEKRQRAARRERLRKDHLYEDAYWHTLWDRVLGATVRYGRQPLLAAAWLLLPFFLGALIFGAAFARDEVKPNLPQIQRAPEWVLCGVPAGEPVRLAGQVATVEGLRQPGQSRIACFHAQPEGRSHPRFDALIYSADTLVPVVSLEMQSYWIPDDSQPFGALARAYLWLHIAMGWGLTLLAVAGFSGLIKQDSK